MNNLSDSTTRQTQRELKPLHPFLRAVACFLAFALMFTGPVPMAVAGTLTPGTLTLTTGSLNISNLAQSGTIQFTVVAGGTFTEDITLVTGTTGTLSIGGLIFSGSSAFQDKPVDLSKVDYLQVASGGVLTLPNGMKTDGPNQGLLLGGSATLNVGSSATQGGVFGGSLPIRVDNGTLTRSTFTVNTGTTGVGNGDNVSGAYLDLGTRLDLIKKGRGTLDLYLSNAGSLSAFSGTITLNNGVLTLGHNFLSDGTSNSLKITPADTSATSTVTVVLDGDAYLTSLNTGATGSAAANAIIGVLPTGSGGRLVLNNASTDSSVFKGVLKDGVDNVQGPQLSVSKSGEGSLLLSNDGSNFGGGFTLNAGSLIVNASSTIPVLDQVTGITTFTGPLGTGALSLRGGTLFVKPLEGDVNITLQNAVSFFSSTDDDYINAGSMGYSALVKRKATFASANGTDSLTLEGELNLGKDLGNLDTFSSNTSVTGGSVTLVVNTPTIIKGTVAGELAAGSVTMSLVKSGAASLTLSGANAYFGDLTVAQGALFLGNNKALGYVDVDTGTYSMNSVTVSSGAVLDLAGSSPEVSVPLSISGTGTGDGALTNSKTDDIGNPVSSTYSGSLTLASASSIGGIADITLSGSVASAYNLTKIGVNTLFFSGTSTMSGSLIVSPEGTAQIASGGSMTFNQTGALDGNLVNYGVLLFNNNVDRTLAGDISGTGALVKLNSNNLTFANGASYTGATTISAGSLIVKGGFASAQISNSGTFNWSPTSDTAYTGTISGSGTTILTSATSVKLTLGSGSNVGAGGALQIGNNVTLSISTGVTLPGSITVLSGGKLELASGADNVFDSSSTKLTISTGGIADLKGNTVSLGTLAMNGGSLYSSLGQASLTFGTLAAAGTAGITASVTLPAFDVQTGTVLAGGTYQLYTGSLGTVSGGTSQILLKPRSGAGSIVVDSAVTAGTSIIAASSGSSAILGLTVQAPVTTPLFDIQSGVIASFLSGGSFSNTGTLQIEGNVALSGKSFNFQNVALYGGSLSGGTLASGSLSATSGTLGATLGASFGNLVKAGSGVLTISGPSTAYAGSLQVTAGTVKLGNSAALGSTGRVSFAASPDAVLQLFGNSLTLSSLDSSVGSYVENGSSSTVVLTLSPNAASSFSGGIRDGGGALSLVKSGTGDLTLSGSLTYTGGTALSNGLLTLLGTTLPNGSLTVSGGSLDFGGQTQNAISLNFTGGLLRNGTLIAPSYAFQTGTITAVLAGTAALVKGGSAQVVLSGNNTYGGGTVVNAGTLSLGVNGALSSSGSVSVTAGELALGATTQTVGALSLSGGSVTGGTLTAASIAAGTGNVTSILSGAGTFTKSGTGTVTLSGANTLTGLMSLQLGTLQLAGNGSLTSGSLQVSGALLDLGAATRSVGALSLSSGSITGGTLNAASYAVQFGFIGATLAGSGDFTKSNPTTVTLSGANTLSGTMSVQAGTLALSGNGKLSSGSLMVSGASTVLLGGGSQSVGAVMLSNGSIGGGTLNGASFAVQSGTVAANLGGATAALTKTGSGQVVLSAANTYGGGTSVNGGTLTLGLNGALLSSGTVSVTVGELALGATTQTVGFLTLSGGSITGGTLSATGFTLQSGVVSSVLGGTGALSKETTGLVTLNAVNTLSGNVVISGGTLQLGTGQALANAGSVQISGGSLTFGSAVSAATLKSLAGDLSLSTGSGAAVTLTLVNDSNTTSAGILSGTGSLVKAGSGNLTLSGANTYTGATSVTAGTLTTAAGALASTSSITVSGAVLKAVNFNAPLTINTTGSAEISGSGSFGAVSNLGSATFTLAGTVTLGSLSGSGVTQFTNGIINGAGVSAGTVSAIGFLQLTTLSGGSASAATLVVGTLSGGRASATSAAMLASMTSGSLELKGATAILQGSVSGGTVSLSNAATLGVNTGSFAGTATLSGTGTLSKTSASIFTLTQTIADTIAVNVQSGTLNATNLFSGNRSITLGMGAQLGVTLTTGTYTGLLTADPTSVLKLSSSAPVTLTLNAANLAGAVTLANSGITLNLASAGIPFATNSSLTLLNGGTLSLGTSDLELSSLTVSGGSLTISGAGGTVYYDTKPSFLTDAGSLISGTNVVVSGSVKFDTLTQGTKISDGTYEYYAGRVLQSGSMISGNQLLLKPKTAATTIRLVGGTFSDSIVAGGTSGGIVSVDGLVYAGSYGNVNGTTTILSNGGTLSIDTSAAPTPISNAGTLKISVTDSTKTVANLISGTGSLEKTGSGLLLMSGSNTYSGVTTLSAGILKMGGSLALGQGTANSISFQGGTLQYGYNVGVTDLSSRIVSSTSGTNVAIDTNGNNVSFGSGLAGQGGLLKAGSGSLTLNAANTFTGAVNLQGGTLQIAQAGSLASASVTVASGGVLSFNRGDAASFAGVLSGAGAAEMVGSGALTLGGSWTGYTGTFSLRAGTLILGSASALYQTGTLAFNGGLLQYGSGVNTDVSALFAALSAGSLRVDTNGNDVTFAGSLSGAGGVLKTGANSLTLSGTNTFSGMTAVNAGSLVTRAGALNNTSAILVSGATLSAANYNKDATLSVDATGRATVTSSGSYGAVANAGSATFSGVTVTLSGLSGAGATSFAGNARISSGSISAGRVAVGGLLQSNLEGGTVTAASLAAGTLSGGSIAVTASASADLVSGGSLTVGGSATLGLMSGGNLALNGALASITTFNGGLVSVNGGTLTVNSGSSDSVISGGGSFVKDGSGSLALNVDGGLAVTGKVTVKAGTLSVLNLSSVAPLTVDGGSLLVSGSGLSLSSLLNGSYAEFSAATGTITLGSLSGAGVTSFARDARISSGSISAGRVAVAGSLQSNVQGGTVTAASLSAGTVSGGSVTVTGAASAALVSGGSLWVGGVASLNTVSGGTFALNDNSAISTFNGGAVSLSSGKTLTVNQGSSAGSVSGSGASLVKEGVDTLVLNSVSTGNVLVSAGTLSAVTYAQDSLLTVAAGQLIVSGSGLTLGTLFNSSSAVFSGTSGTITLGSLNGSGTTTFASNAIINSSVISDGTISANSGRLQLTTVSGGSVRANNLVLSTLSGGQATATSAGSIGTMSAGALALTTGSLTVGSLTGGAIALSNATLSVNSGSYAGSLSGTGTLAKTGTGTSLTLSTLPPETVGISVLGGSLLAGNLLTGQRAFNVNSGAFLSLTLTTGTYSGTLTGSGTTFLSSSAPSSTLTLGSLASLDGALRLDPSNLTLDLSSGNTNKFGSNASLTLLSSGSLVLGGPLQELELNSLNVSSGSLYITGSGGKILYDEKPAFLTGSAETFTLTSGSLLTGGGSSVYVTSGSVTFDVLTQGTLLAGNATGGSYQYTAGRVQLKGGTLLNAGTLLLDPKLSTSVLRIAGGTVSGAILAGGTSNKGVISVEGTVAAGSLWVNSGVMVKLTQAGSLQAGSIATPITNNGSLQISVTDVSKTVSNLISGSGSLEKIDAGLLVLSGSNTYSGATTLTAGTVRMGGSLALGGTASAILFKGGILQYGYNIGVTDLSSRIASSTAGNSVAIDTNGYDIAFANGLSGSGGLAKIGTGKLTLSGNNTFAETALLQQGTLEITAGSLAAGVNVSAGGLLRFNRTDLSTYGGSLSGTGSIEKAGSGILTLTGSDSGFSGILGISAGTLEAGNSSALNNGTLAFTGGILRYANLVTTDVSARVAALSSGDAKIDTNGNSVSFATGFSGSRGLTKLGAGSLILSGSSTYGGTTTVNAGTLSATVSGALGSTGSLAVKSGATLNAVDFNPTASVVVDISGRAIVSGAGVSAGTVSNAGSLSFTANSGTVTVGSLVGTGASDFAADAVIQGAGVVQGRVSVAGSLQALIAGGSVTAGTLGSASVSAGSVTVTSGVASLGTVSGGSLTLLGVTNTIVTLNGGAVALGDVSVLTVQAGSTAGVISGSGSLVKDGSGTLRSANPLGLAFTGNLTVSNGTLDTVRYSSSMATVGALGRLIVSGADLILGTLVNGNVASFTANSGTITLGSLNGSGTTSFASNAVVNSPEITDGVITAGSGRLQLTTLSGGSVSAKNLVLTTLSGGQATATLAGSIGTMSSGTLALTGGGLTVGSLTGGAIALSNATLSVNSGSYAGSLSGTGTLVKTAAGTSLTLSSLPPETVGISVLGGSLFAGNLLTGQRAISVNSGSFLNLTLNTGTYSGTLTSSGTTLLSSTAPSTLTLGSLASLDGALRLDPSNLTLDLSVGNTNKFGSNASLTLLNSGSLVIGGPLQELELNSLNLSSGSLYLSGSGGKILYDEKPAFLTGSAETFTLTSGSYLSNGGTSSVYVTSGSVTFDVLTQGTLLAGSVNGGSYQYTAGRVQLKGGTLLNAGTLLLDPKLSTTVIRIAGGTVSGSILAGGTSNKGIISVEGTVSAGSLFVNSGVTVKLTQAGSLTNSGGSTSITNNGSLQFSVTDVAKTVGNLISGTGSLEKVGAGALTLSGASTYTGKTLLSGGTLVFNNAQSFGSGTIAFNGGGLKYGSVSTDLSSRIATLTSDAVIDTNGMNVTFATGLQGSGGLKKLGTGALVLSGANGFAGAVEVVAGTLQVGSGTTGSLLSSATVNAGAFLSFARSDSGSYAGSLSGSGTVEQDGSGPLTLTGAGLNFTGTMLLNNGVLVFGNALALDSGTLRFNGGSLKYGSGITTDLSGRIDAIPSGKAAVVDTNGNDVTFGTALSGAGGFTKLGGGALTFNSTNSYAGPTTLSAGSLIYNGVSSGAVILTGGTLGYNLYDGQTLSGTVAATAGTSVYFNNGSVATGGTFTGVISGAGKLFKSGLGSVALLSSQANTGGATISAGTLALGTTSSTVSLGGKGSIITISTGATLDATNGEFDSSASLVLSTGSILKLGNATLNLAKITIQSGATLVSGEGASIIAVVVEGGTNNTSSTVTVGTAVVGATGYASVTSASGTLAGRISGGTYDSLSAAVATNLKITADVSLQGAATIGSGSVTLAKELSASSVTLGSGSGSTSLTIQAGGAIKSDSVTFTAGTLTMSGSIGAATSGGGSFVFGGTSAGGSTAAAVTLDGGAAKITAQKVKLTGGSNLTLTGSALSALNEVKSLEVGGAGSSGTLTISSGTFILASGNTLKGSGRIEGKVNIGPGSILSPGNSPGTLSVGTATVATGATLVLEHGKGANVDQVTGTSLAFQTNSNIVIVDYERSLLSGTSSYTPFSGFAPGAVTGGSLVNVIVSVRLGNDTGTVGDTGVSYTTAVSARYTGTYSGGTIAVTSKSLAALASSGGNTTTVANAIDERLLASAGTFSISGLDEIGTGADKATALANLASQLAAANPAGYAELAGLSTQRLLTIGQGLINHFNSLRAGLLEVKDRELAGWVSTYGNWQKQNGDSTMGTAGFSGNTWGSMFGAEQRRGDLIFGVTGAAGQTTADFQKLTGHVTTDAWHLGGYATARMGRVVLESSALFGMTDTKARRTVSAPGMTSREGRLSVTGTEWMFNTGAALPLVAPGSLTFTPSARLLVQGQNIGSAKENDMSGLEVSVAKQSTTSVLSQAGAELRKNMKLVGKSAAASLQADWLHNYNPNGRTLNMAMGGSTTYFGYQGSKAGADAIRMGGAFEAALNERTTLRLNLDYQTQTGGSSTNGMLSLGYAF